MKNTLISETEAFELAHGRVPGRPDLDQLADLFTEYRSAAIGPTPRPSAELAARLDLSATPIVMQRDAVADGETAGVGVRRTVSGLFGLGVTVTIILGAASGAAAVVGAGSAGLLPPGAQDAFNQVVSLVVPPGVVGPETTDQGEAPGDRTESGIVPKTSGESSDDTTEGDSLDPAKQGQDNSNANHGTSGKGEPQNAGNGNSENSNGRAGDSGSVTTDEVTTPGNSGNGNGNGNGNSETNSGNSGNGNSGNGNGNSGNGNGNGNSGNGNGNGNGNGKKP